MKCSMSVTEDIFLAIISLNLLKVFFEIVFSFSKLYLDNLYVLSYFLDFIKFCITEISFSRFSLVEQFELKSHENAIGTSDRILHKEQLNISV